MALLLHANHYLLQSPIGKKTTIVSPAKCKWFITLSGNTRAVSIDDTWTTKCSDPCTPGFCEVYVDIRIPNTDLTKRANLYYIKESKTAYVAFPPSLLKELGEKGILKVKELQIETDAPKKLPNALH